jgi:hypothetical protein
MKLMQSGASAALMQGMLQNYTEFLGEMYQGWMAMMSEGQTALLHQAEEVTDNVIDVTVARGGVGVRLLDRAWGPFMQRYAHRGHTERRRQRR